MLKDAKLTAAGRGAERSLRNRVLRAEQRYAPYVLVAPFFVLFAGFGVFPIGFTLWVSLHRWDLIGGGADDFVGAANFTRLVSDPHFWNATWNTLSIWLISTAPQLLFALVLAAALNSRMRARTLFRMGVLVPSVASVAAVTIIFSQLFGRDFGFVNYVLGLAGFAPVDWHADRFGAHLAISIMIMWRWTGYNALIYLAAMQAIPRELYEAAWVDGVSRFQQFRHITVPLLRPAIIFTVVMSTIGGFQLFAEPLLFDPSPGGITGGSDRQFQTLAVYIYEEAFRNFNMGYGAAIAWALFLLIAVVSLINYLLARQIRSVD